MVKEPPLTHPAPDALHFPGSPAQEIHGYDSNILHSMQSRDQCKLAVDPQSALSWSVQRGDREPWNSLNVYHTWDTPASMSLSYCIHTNMGAENPRGLVEKPKTVFLISFGPLINHYY